MMMLDYMTWVRFIIWIIVGLVIYFGYGIWHSKERPTIKNALKNEANVVDDSSVIRAPGVIGISKEKLVS